MKLVTKRLILREGRDKDVKEIVKVCNDKDIFLYTARISYPYTLRYAKNWIKLTKKEKTKKPRTDYTFLIELKETGKVIGSIGLHRISRIHKKASIGYWLGKEYRRKGYMKEAEERILEFAFNKLKLNKVYGEAVVENKASNKLFKRFGFRKVGRKEEELIKNNKKLGIKELKQDTYLWELLKKNWKK